MKGKIIMPLKIIMADSSENKMKNNIKKMAAIIFGVGKNGAPLK